MDIVERLRSWSHAQSNHPQLLREAADEIARLQAENERLRELLTEARQEATDNHSALTGTKAREDALALRTARAECENERLRAVLMLGQAFMTEQTGDNADAFEQAMIAALAPPPQR